MTARNQDKRKRGLNWQQQRFAEEYVVNGGNATQAALTAGYSTKTAYSQGHRLLKHVEVKAAIEAMRGLTEVRIYRQWAETYIGAKDKRDYNVCATVTRDQARSLAMLTDKVQTEDVTEPALEAHQATEAKEVARIRIHDVCQPEPPPGPTKEAV